MKTGSCRDGTPRFILNCLARFLCRRYRLYFPPQIKCISCAVINKFSPTSYPFYILLYWLYVCIGSCQTPTPALASDLRSFRPPPTPTIDYVYCTGQTLISSRPPPTPNIDYVYCTVQTLICSRPLTTPAVDSVSSTVHTLISSRPLPTPAIRCYPQGHLKVISTCGSLASPHGARIFDTLSLC